MTEKALKILLEMKNKDLKGTFTLKELKEKMTCSISSPSLKVLEKNGIVEILKEKPNKYKIINLQKSVSNDSNTTIDENYCYKKSFEVNKNETRIFGEAQFFKKDFFNFIVEVYKDWKEINQKIKKIGGRRINIPEIITEGIACYINNWGRINDTNIVGLDSSSADAIDIRTGETIQIKAASSSNNLKTGPTSFGPNTVFDRLVFIHLNYESNILEIYDFKENYKKLMVNKSETLEDQQKMGKRPRVNLLNIIKQNKIKPNKVILLEKEEE